MATPIRWDTIMTRGNPEGTNGINSAANLINNGIAQFQGVLKNTQDLDTENFKNQKAGNTAAFQDAVARYRSPEELQAAIGSGELDKLRSSLGPNIDRDAVRGAAQAQLSTLMSQKQKAIEFNHLMTDEATAMDVQNYRAAVLKGDTQGAAAAQAAYQAKNGRDLSSLATYADQRERQIVERGYADGEFTMKQERQKADIKHMNNQDAQDAARTGLQRKQLDNDTRRLGLQEEEMGHTRVARAETQVNNNLERMSKFATVTAGSEQGQAKINEEIAKIRDPDVQANARRVVSNLSKDGNITVAGVLAALATVDKRDWFANGDILYSNANVVEDATKVGKEFVKSPAATAYQKRQEVGYAAAQANYEASQKRLEELRKKLDGGTSQSTKSPFN